MQKSTNHQRIGYKAFKIASLNTLVVTTIASLIFSVLSYVDFQKQYQASVKTIEESFLASLGNAGWSYDDDQLYQIAEGIQKLPYVQSVKISITPYFEIITTPQSQQHFEPYLFDITHDESIIGDLQITMDKGLLYSQLTRIAINGVLVALIMSILIGVLTYIAIRRMISARVVEIAQQAANLRLDDNTSRFTITRPDKSPLELISIVKALNDMLSDIKTEREKSKRYQFELEQAANYDSLTHLPNRHYAENTVARIMAQQEGSLVAIFINFGSFKFINESFGRSVGDRFLIHVADRLKSNYPNHYISRLGKDNFLLICVDDEPECINEKVPRLLETLSKPVEIKGLSESIELKIFLGISSYPKTAMNVEELFTQGEIAMRISKKQNLPIVYDKHFSQNVRLQNQIRLLLPKAIRNQAFHLHFQPIINLETRELYSMECLIRWTDETLGRIRPDIFIEIAEEEGVISEIDQFLFTQSMTEFKRIQQALGDHIILSLNVSYLHFKEPSFVQFVANQLRLNEFNANRLKIEITERVFLDDEHSVREKMQQLIEMGVTLAIDDFGTGYSSINSVKSLPFSTLKMDKSLINMISKSERDFLLVKNVIRMAHDLGLNVVAEGVETEDQVSILQNANCTYCQGYYFEKPHNVDYFLKTPNP